jgi:hypothetical protein
MLINHFNKAPGLVSRFLPGKFKLQAHQVKHQGMPGTNVENQMGV